MFGFPESGNSRKRPSAPMNPAAFEEGKPFCCLAGCLASRRPAVRPAWVVKR